MSIYAIDPDFTLWHGEALNVLATLPEASVDLVVTDPPYGVTSLGWDQRVESWPAAVARVLKPTGSLWCFGSFRFFFEQGAEAFKGWRYAQEIVWEKHNGSNFHADRFRRVHELVVQFYPHEWEQVWKSPVVTNDAVRRTIKRRKQRPPHTGHIEKGAYASEDGGPRLQRSIIRVRSCHGHAVHETQKPEGILRPLIEYSCPRGGIVLDPFAGSGSTLMAARDLGRQSIGIEISEDYCKAAADRLNQLSLLAEAAS